MKSLLRRLKGALGIIAASSVGFTIVSWMISIGKNLILGQDFGGVRLMIDFTLAMLTGGAIIGVFVAGGIALAGPRFRELPSGVAFLAGLGVGLPLGAGLTFLFGPAMPVAYLLINATFIGVLTGVSAASLTAIANRAPKDQTSRLDSAPEARPDRTLV